MPTSIRLPEETEERLDRLARATGRSKAFYLRELITSGLDQLEWEYSVAQNAVDIRAGRRTTVSRAEARRELGLDE
ncbi:ribbon-helix-helix protein, CopG family [Cryobacterium sp. Y50]|uniref:type II toxin-antitoxin system RelB family antitoxin n=1 Tax=Cryobacterium sp. Y50 TaxID=2048286 RepID=UPI000CE389AA|nr:ribbon-helix-helix protein, CopG family [Cryobacterium sp. Y50]